MPQNEAESGRRCLGRLPDEKHQRASLKIPAPVGSVHAETERETPFSPQGGLFAPGPSSLRADTDRPYRPRCVRCSPPIQGRV